MRRSNKKENALLLTVETPEGVLLATFSKKVDEINLLVNVRDAVEFSLPKYLPFIDDPKIIRVERERRPEAEATPLEKPKESGMKTGQQGKQEKTRAAAPATGATGTRRAAP
ncbi:MAG: hypothetical protein M0042_05270 [Nitrospiraceae bacterium]|nr:hypothetical protein [Nitrospiraceae bacterium]